MDAPAASPKPCCVCAAQNGKHCAKQLASVFQDQLLDELMPLKLKMNEAPAIVADVSPADGAKAAARLSAARAANTTVASASNNDTPGWRGTCAIYLDPKDKECDDKSSEYDERCPLCRSLAYESDAEWVGRVQKHVDKGNAEAQIMLGTEYRDGGTGLEQDFKRAKINLKASAQWTRRSYDEAVRWYRFAAAQGHAEALFNLGVCHANGQVVPQDDHEALRFLKRAAVKGSMDLEAVPEAAPEPPFGAAPSERPPETAPATAPAATPSAETAPDVAPVPPPPETVTAPPFSDAAPAPEPAPETVSETVAEAVTAAVTAPTQSAATQPASEAAKAWAAPDAAPAPEPAPAPPPAAKASSAPEPAPPPLSEAALSTAAPEAAPEAAPSETATARVLFEEVTAPATPEAAPAAAPAPLSAFAEAPDAAPAPSAPSPEAPTPPLSEPTPPLSETAPAPPPSAAGEAATAAAPSAATEASTATVLSAAAEAWAPPLSAAAVAWAPPFVAAPGEEVRIMVGNIPYGAVEDDVRFAFEGFCQVDYVEVPTSRSSGNSRGFAFVVMDPSVTKEAGEELRLKMDGTVLGNRVVRAEHAHATPARVNALRIQAELMRDDISASAILDLFDGRAGSLDAVNLATALHRLGVLDCPFISADDQRVRRLLDQATANIREEAWSPRCLANSCWGCGRLGLFDAEDFFNAVADATIPQLTDFKPQELAVLISAFAKVGVSAPSLFEGVKLQGVSQIDKFLPQNLANMVWAFATAGRRAPELFAAVAVEALRQISNFNPQELSNTVWAFAKLEIRAVDLFQAISIEARNKLWSANPQNLANILWAFAKAGVSAPRLFELIADEALAKIRDFGKYMANVVWALAHAGVEAVMLFKAVALVFPKKIGAFNSLALSSTVWAFAKAGLAAPALFAAVAGESIKKMATFTAQNLANTVWAFSKMRIVVPSLFEAVSAEALKKMTEFKAQELSELVWAFATAGFAAPLLFEAAAVEAVVKIAEFKPPIASWAYVTAGTPDPAVVDVAKGAFEPEALADVAWAFATAGVEASQLFEVMASSISAQIGEFSPAALSQLHQVMMHLKMDVPQNPLTVLLCSHAHDLRAAYLAKEPNPSRTTRDVSAALARIGWEHDFLYLTAGGLRLDMASPSTKLAVEFDGPIRYLQRGAGPSFFSSVLDGWVLDGQAKAKERLLKGLGWNVLHISCFDWDKLRSTAGRGAFLRSKMFRHVTTAADG
ncbi:hypothetical protein M885DRAFT_614791 [Pelagophyceae sp. CCMP2097]|nr:hypothetical protein M885DRAFT_614791 [Pelagophyceae sp. CCMP2097]